MHKVKDFKTENGTVLFSHDSILTKNLSDLRYVKNVGGSSRNMYFNYAGSEVVNMREIRKKFSDEGLTLGSVDGILGIGQSADIVFENVSTGDDMGYFESTHNSNFSIHINSGDIKMRYGMDARYGGVMSFTTDKDSTSTLAGIYSDVNSRMTVALGDKDDNINNINSYFYSTTTVDMGGGNDSIGGVWASNSTISVDLGAGNDSIGNIQAYGNSKVTVNGGAGDDTISAIGGDGTIVLNGDAGNDTIYSGIQSTNVAMTGGAGDDVINSDSASNAHHTLNGGEGNDTLNGGSGTGKRIYNGGKGDDIIHGNAHADNVYKFQNGDGNDTVYNKGGANTNTQDTVLLHGYDKEDIWLKKAAQDLKIKSLYSDDTVTIKGYFNDDASKVDSIELTDGHALSKQAVQKMIQAMSGYNPDTLGIDAKKQKVLPDEVQKTLASSWKATQIV